LEAIEHEPSLRNLSSILPRVSDYFTVSSRVFLLQFIQGDDLATMIKQQPGPFPRNSVIAWADQLLDALIYLHSHDRKLFIATSSRTI